MGGLDTRYGQAAAAEEAGRRRVETGRLRIRGNLRALEGARRDHALARAGLAARLSAVYRQRPLTEMEVILGSASLSEALAHAQLLSRLRDQDASLLGRVRRARDRLAALRAELLIDQASYRRELGLAAARAREVGAVLAERRAALTASRRVLGTLIAQEAERRAAAARARVAALRAAQARVAVQLASPPSPAAPAALPPSVPVGGLSGKLAAIARCESGGNPTAVSPSGAYRGKYQFAPETWRNAGGSGSDPAAATEGEQDRVAAALYAREGSSPWPVCGR